MGAMGTQQSSKEPQENDLLVPFEIQNLPKSYKAYYVVKRNNFFSSIQGFPEMWTYYTMLDEIWLREFSELKPPGRAAQLDLELDQLADAEQPHIGNGFKRALGHKAGIDPRGAADHEANLQAIHDAEGDAWTIGSFTALAIVATGWALLVSLACAPDGKTIFFAARGVVWSVPSAGSATPEARRIRVGDGVVADPSGTKILVRGMEGSEIHRADAIYSVEALSFSPLLRTTTANCFSGIA